MPVEDLDLNSKTFQWPALMDPIFEVSQQRLLSRREEAEDQVKAKSVRVFGCGPEFVGDH